MGDEGRRAHYGEFYGLAPVPRTGVPLLLVHGNCQAEALRVSLAGADLDTVRVPPVHELTPEDVPHLHSLLRQVDVLVTQPVTAGYHDLPLGTDDVRAELAPGATTVRIPSVRYAGLYPYQELVRADGVQDPPLVPYHDLRVLARAAGVGGGPSELDPDALAAAYREVSRASLAELARRERLHGTVPASDLVAGAGADAGWTINHPGNSVLLGLAGRVREVLGLDPVAQDPGRVLLRSVRTPLLAEVLQALGVTAPARQDWLVEGEPVPDADIAAEHTRWYAEHPDVLRAGVEAHAERLRTLGWRP